MTALIALDPESLQSWADHNGMGGRSYEELVASPEARAMVQTHVDELNAKLSRWETVKKFEILPRDLTVEDDDLTPSMKVKRKVVETRYRDLLDRMYAA